MKAVVLVGGFGTRLRPLTNDTPKQMLPIVDRPMIEWVLAHLGSHGVDEVVLSLGFRPEKFTNAYPDGRCAGVALTCVVEPEPLDTAGAAKFAAEQAGISETFLVLNGDVITGLDVSNVVARHQATGAEATIALTEVEDPSRYGVVPIDSDGRVEAFIEKPDRESAPSRWINAGTYVLEPTVLDRIAGDRRVSIERETFPALVEDRSVFAVQSNASWIDTGTPESYIRIQNELCDEGRADNIAVDASVDADATVERSIIMAGATVAAGATIRGSVLFPGAIVAAGAVINDSIVAEGARIEAGGRLSDYCIVGAGETVAAESHLSGVRFPLPE